MASPPRLHKVFRFPAPKERTGVIGIVVLSAAPDRRNALVNRVEDRVLQPLAWTAFEKNPSTAFIQDAEVAAHHLSTAGLGQHVP